MKNVNHYYLLMVYYYLLHVQTKIIDEKLYS